MPHGPSIFIKLLDSPCNFAHVDLEEDDTVADLAERACNAFRSWRTDPARLTLLLALAGGCDKPTAPEEAAARPLDSSWSAARAGIASGAWLLARRAPEAPLLQLLLPALLRCAAWLLLGGPAAARGRAGQGKVE
jgi:hypothetical protein